MKLARTIWLWFRNRMLLYKFKCEMKVMSGRVAKLSTTRNGEEPERANSITESQNPPQLCLEIVIQGEAAEINAITEGNSTSAIIPEMQRRTALEPIETPCSKLDNLFRTFDAFNTGMISTKPFREVMRKFYLLHSYPQYATRHLESRFRVGTSDFINYEDIIKFFRLQKASCVRHGKPICAQCITYGYCTQSEICGCTKYKSSSSKNTDMVCECGHARDNHQIFPTQMFEDRRFSEGEIIPSEKVGQKRYQ